MHGLGLLYGVGFVVRVVLGFRVQGLGLDFRRWGLKSLVWYVGFGGCRGVCKLLFAHGVCRVSGLGFRTGYCRASFSGLA